MDAIPPSNVKQTLGLDALLHKDQAGQLGHISGNECPAWTYLGRGAAFPSKSPFHIMVQTVHSPGGLVDTHHARLSSDG